MFSTSKLDKTAQRVPWYMIHFDVQMPFFATGSWNFSTSELQKIVRCWCFLFNFTRKCARHSCGQFFDISSRKRAPGPSFFPYFHKHTKKYCALNLDLKDKRSTISFKVTVNAWDCRPTFVRRSQSSSRKNKGQCVQCWSTTLVELREALPCTTLHSASFISSVQTIARIKSMISDACSRGTVFKRRSSLSMPSNCFSCAALKSSEFH